MQNIVFYHLKIVFKQKSPNTNCIEALVAGRGVEPLTSGL